jgi:hypothetical protein
MDAITIDADVRGNLAARGFAWIPRTAWSIGPGLVPHWQRLGEDWGRLEPDRYLAKGAKFRLWRYGRYYWAPGADTLSALPHETYFQPADENPYAGGIVREFAPLLPETVRNPFLHALVRATFSCLPVPAARQGATWEVRVHQIRIVAAPGGRRAKYVTERDALAHVAGYTCANDVSAHDLEFRTSQWTSGKMLDTFCPLGPVLLTADEVPDPSGLRLRTTLNGRTVQEAWTSDMVFSVPFLVSYVSSLATLEPGDLILTGTPAGIGCNRNPQVFLQPGDSVSVTVDGVGTLTNPVVAEGGR